MITVERVLAGVSAISIALAIALLLEHGVRREYEMLAHEAPPAQDALVQAIDLADIHAFRFVDSQRLDIVDNAGRHYNMQFMEPCPGLKQATSFSLVTSDYQNMDRFIGIAVKGHVCTFREFSPV
jgi:hypothetical protein